MTHNFKAILKNEKGFTLMEILVVLAIFLIIHTIIIIYSHEPLVEYTEKQLMNQNELLIRMAQLRSIETLEPHRFWVINCRNIVVKNRSTREFIFEQTLPPHIDMLISTPTSSFIFNTRGNVQDFGGLSYHFGRVSYRYSVNIGKGNILDKGVFYDAARDNTCRNVVSSRHFIFSHIDDHSDNT